jgi:hypothetical protein
MDGYDIDRMFEGYVCEEDVAELRADNERLRAALERARSDLLDLAEYDELLAPAVERIDAALQGRSVPRSVPSDAGPIS